MMMMMMMMKRCWFILCLLTTANSLVRDIQHAFRTARGSQQHILYMVMEPPPSSRKVKAKSSSPGTLLPQTEFPPLVTARRPTRRRPRQKTSSSNRNNGNDNGTTTAPQKRPPVVDSTLLRFLGKEKKSLLKQQQIIMQSSSSYRNNGAASNNNQTTTAVLPQVAKDLVISMTNGILLSSSSSSSLATPPPLSIESSPVSSSSSSPPIQTSLSSSSSSSSFAITTYTIPNTALDDMDIATADTWWGQFNSHRVEAVLLSQDPSLDRSALSTAAVRVQSQALARAARRRIRAFLKRRDQAWTASDSTSSSASRSNDNTASSSLSSSVSVVKVMTKDGREFKDVVEMLLEKGLTANDIVAILHHTPGIALMRPRANDEDMGAALETTIDRALHLLCETLQLRRYDARKVIRNCPGLLTMVGSKSAEQVVALLVQLSVSHNSLARDKTALPILLSRSPASMFRLVAFLTSDAIRMPMNQIGPLLRRPQCLDLLNVVAPVPRSSSSSTITTTSNYQNDDGENNLISRAVIGTMVDSNDNNNGASMNAATASSFYMDADTDPGVAAALWGRESHLRREQINDAYRRMSKTAWTLRYQIGTVDLGKVIAAYPAVLLLDAETQILPNAEYLMNQLGIWQDDLPRVLQLYPALLGMPVADMERVAMYLTSLEVPAENLGSIFRSFPALLTLDIRKDMVPVIAFLRTIGVTNMGRFISRLPPVLGYSVRRELVPKWRFLQSIHADARFEVSKFPAYFSYPLERVIKTRYEYIQHVRRIPPQLLPLDKVVSYGDNDFAVKVMGDADGGKAFRQFVEDRRKRLQKESLERSPRGGGGGGGGGDGTTSRTTNNGETASTKRASSQQSATDQKRQTQAKQPQQQQQQQR